MKYRETGQKRRILGLFFIAALIFTGCSAPSSEGNSQFNREMVPQPYDPETLVAPVEIQNDEQLSKENFGKIKNGMKLEEVELIILGNSALISSEVVKGKLNETYRWETPDSARFIEVKFVENKVVSKSQKGLK